MAAYQIRMSGCDDSTVFVMDLTDAEAALLGRVAARAFQASAFECQPRMTISPVTAPPAPKEPAS